MKPQGSAEDNPTFPAQWFYGLTSSTPEYRLLPQSPSDMAIRARSADIDMPPKT